jgi:hypothetical protein
MTEAGLHSRGPPQKGRTVPRLATIKANQPPEVQLVWEACEDFTFNPSYNRVHALYDPGKVVQVRQEEEPPSSSIDKYVLAFERGDAVPPVVFTADGYLVDGRRRNMGMERIKGATTIPALVIDVIYSKAPEPVVNNVKQLALRLNMTHGDKMNARNIADVLFETSPDDEPRVIAARLKVSPNTVHRVLAMRRAAERAERNHVDIEDTSRVSASHLAILGQKEKQLTEPVFTGVLTVSRDARLSTNEMQDLIREVGQAGSEQEKLAVIAQSVKLNQERINGLADRPTGGPARVLRLYGMLRAAVGENPELLVVHDQDSSEDYLRKLNLMIDWLNKIGQAQVVADRSRDTAIKYPFGGFRK